MKNQVEYSVEKEISFNALNTRNKDFIDKSKTDVLSAIAKKENMSAQDVEDEFGEMTLEEIFTLFKIKEPKATGNPNNIRLKVHRKLEI